MNIHVERVHPKGRAFAWVEDRLRALSCLAAHTMRSYSPKNLNVWYYFGFFVLWIDTRTGFERNRPVPMRVTSH